MPTSSDSPNIAPSKLSFLETLRRETGGVLTRFLKSRIQSQAKPEIFASGKEALFSWVLFWWYQSTKL